ncbi:hypothetical protein [Streptacidiphilus rugosus]|uniref:hypothetical protein n=1 Tax=Streptacidiphilus rugosus TaxID=405783 RepID=UPI00068A7FDA|nr:hypothetical protein [Streptacidiphilus rugosus]
MHVLGWTALLLLVGAAAATGYWWWRYPGAARFAFGPAFAADRRALRGARREHRAHRRRLDRHLASHQAGVKTAEREQQKRIRTAERALADAREPGPGARLDALDSVVLHERVLRIRGKSLALGEVTQAESVPQGDFTELVVRLAYGGIEREDYPSRRGGGAKRGDEGEEPAGSTAPLRSYRTVRSFADRITNAAADERRRLDQLPQQLDRLKREVEEAKGDTGAVDESRAGLERARTRADRDPELLRSRDDLEDAREIWRELAGRLPPE